MNCCGDVFRGHFFAANGKEKENREGKFSIVEISETLPF